MPSVTALSPWTIALIRRSGTRIAFATAGNLATHPARVRDAGALYCSKRMQDSIGRTTVRRPRRSTSMMLASARASDEPRIVGRDLELYGHGQRFCMRDFDPCRDLLRSRLQQRLRLRGRKRLGPQLRRQQVAELNQQERLAAPGGIGQAKRLRVGGPVVLDQPIGDDVGIDDDHSRPAAIAASILMRRTSSSGRSKVAFMGACCQQTSLPANQPPKANPCLGRILPYDQAVSRRTPCPPSVKWPP